MSSVTVFVDSAPGIVSLLDELNSIPSDSTPATGPPPLYCDLEGIYLGRQGSLSLLTIYAPQAGKVYLIDVFTLQHAAFLTASHGRSLKAVLEDSRVGKAFFDIRNDSDALYSHYGVAVAGIHDIQLMELASRSGYKRTVAGLARCIDRDIGILTTSSAVKLDGLSAKQAGERLWNPDKGGRYEVFNERPLRPEIIRYCAVDVALLPQLWEVYNKRLGTASSRAVVWRDRIQRETIERIRLSQSVDYNGKGRHMALGPASFQ